MKKTPSLFVRNYTGDRLVIDQIVEGSEWVANGEGIATRKWDGTCCLIKDGILYKRHEVKKGKTRPECFIPSQEPDAITGDITGWVKVGDGPEDARHREAFDALKGKFDGTYELCGPKVQGNPEGFDSHVLVSHGYPTLPDAPRTYDAIRDYLKDNDIEGIVWHHLDGRMVKIKGKDFGLVRNSESK